MRSPVKIALLAAIPFEFVNFCLLSYRVGDESLPRHGLHRLIALQWLILHWLGILSLHALDSMGSSALWEIMAFFFCGYCETFVVFAIVLFALRGLRHSFADHHAPGGRFRMRLH